MASEATHWRRTRAKIVSESRSLGAMLPVEAVNASRDGATNTVRELVSYGEDSAAVLSRMHSGYSADQITEDWFPDYRV